MIQILHLIVAAAAFGFVACLTVHVASLLGARLPGAVNLALFLGVFPVFFSAIMVLQRQVRRLRLDPRQGMRTVVRESPRWLLWLSGASIAYAFACWVSLFAKGRAAGPLETSPEASGFILLFYAWPMTLLRFVIRQRKLEVERLARLRVREWAAPRGEPFILSLPSLEVNGLGFGDSVARLEQVGRPDEDDPLVEGAFTYRALGFRAGHEGERINYIDFIFRDDCQEGFSPCRLSVDLEDGRRLDLTPATTVDDVRAAFGPPRDTDVGEMEQVLVYERAGNTIECELTREGKLIGISAFPKEEEQSAQ